MDDFKLCAGTANNLKKELDIATNVLKDIDMNLGAHNCAYIKNNTRKQTNNKVHLEINNIIIQPAANDGTYKYSGQGENIAYVGEVNK